MGAIAVPILPGKLDQRMEMSKTLDERRADFEDMNARMGLTRHRAWLQDVPDGGHLVIAVHEGPGADTFMERMAASDHPFDLEFKSHLADVHGMDLSGPLPLMPALKIDGTDGS